MRFCTMAKKKIELEIPSVLAFEKKIVVSDGFFYGTIWNDEHNASETPLKIVEKSVRGTISNRFKPSAKKDPAKLNASVEKANLQVTDSCALGSDLDTIKLFFTIKVLSGIETPYVCNSQAFEKSYHEAVTAYINKTGFKELAYRYAYNIASGRFLWRNRIGAESIDVIVHVGSDKYQFNAYDYSLNDFTEKHEELIPLAEKIANVLCGKEPYCLIEVSTYAKIGLGQEVYPSEELVFDKDNSKKSKVLYQVNDIAAFHSQKLSNAIRKIDTWYSEFGSETGVGPIAIEPYGSVTQINRAFRPPTEKTDFYSFFDDFALNKSLKDASQEHYVMAVLVRGGVFGKASD